MAVASICIVANVLPGSGDEKPAPKTVPLLPGMVPQELPAKVPANVQVKMKALRPAIHHIDAMRPQQQIPFGRNEDEIKNPSEMVNSELAFVDHVCQLTENQRKEIRAECNKALPNLNEKIRNYAATRSGMRVHDLVRSNILAIVEKHVTPEQLVRYETEDSLRRKSRRQAYVGQLVLLLDAQLFLTKKQRQQLTSKLESRLDPVWEISIESPMPLVVRALPAEIMSPILTEEQKAIWQSITLLNNRRSVLVPQFSFDGEPW